MFRISFYSASALILLSVLNACTDGIEKKSESGVKPVAVTLSSPSKGEQGEILASGTVEASQTTNISTRLMGRITDIFVKPGDKVKRGQLLARVWDEDIKAKKAQTDAMISEAESAYNNAQKDLERYNNLYNQQSATAKELDNITLQYNSAKSKLAAANQLRREVVANLSYNNLTAPYSGVVTQKLADVGSIANPGIPILTIEENEMFRVSASIAESDIIKIHLGDIAHVQIKSAGKSIVGKIMEINPSSQFTGGQYIVKISIPESSEGKMYAGMFATVSIPVKNMVHASNDITLIPLAAIVNRDELTGVYTVSVNHTAYLRWIRLGKNFGDKVEVISGLSKDEKFISTSESKLYNGAPIVVKEMPEVSMVTGNRK